MGQAPCATTTGMSLPTVPMWRTFSFLPLIQRVLNPLLIHNSDQTSPANLWGRPQSSTHPTWIGFPISNREIEQIDLTFHGIYRIGFQNPNWRANAAFISQDPLPNFHSPEAKSSCIYQVDCPVFSKLLLLYQNRAWSLPNSIVF